MITTNILVFIGGLGGTEILLLLFVILLLFGAKKIPELARGLGKGIREFKDATKDIKNELEESVKEDPKKV
jgi:sec-independent protein translocase protein TatA